MKIEDLRLNDLVLFDEGAIRVDSIDGDSGTINIEYTKYGEIINHISIEDISPIPLTPEILEKNGFVYNETREAWELIPNNGFGICREEEDNNNFYFCHGVYDPYNRDSDTTYHNIAKVEYVHKLQHLLRDCEIEKEIIL